MNYYDELVKSCPPLCGSAFGEKEDGYDARLAQAKLLSELMRSRRPFCFLRWGTWNSSICSPNSIIDWMKSTLLAGHSPEHRRTAIPA